MAYRHHHDPPPPPSFSSSLGRYSFFCNHQSPPCQHPPPSPTSSDPLLQALVSHLLQNPQIQSQLHYQIPTNDTTATHFSSYLHHPNHPHPSNQKHPRHHHSFAFQESAAAATAARFLTQYLQSLIQRIEDLECTLRELSSSSSSSSSSFSRLRDAAARVIQTRFRAFLVQRSIALRQLKELASMKSTLASIKSSFSIHPHVDFCMVSRKAADLLTRVDAIQDGDQMIRDSKRSITREIIQFLELVDGFHVNGRWQLAKTSKSAGLVRSGSKSRVLSFVLDNENLSQRNAISGGYGLSSHTARSVKELKNRVERIRRMSRALEDDDDGVIDENDHDGNQRNYKDGVSVRHDLRPEAKKHVSFVEEGTALGVYGDEEDEIKIVQGAVENFDKLSIESDQQENEESESSSQAGDDGGNLKKQDLTTVTYNGKGQSHWGQNEKLVYCAPLLMKMDSRGDLIIKKKPGVKIAE